LPFLGVVTPIVAFETRRYNALAARQDGRVRSPCLRVDFQNADVDGRIRLTTVGTVEDLSPQAVTLADGLAVSLVDAELSASAVVRWSDTEAVWVAELTSPIATDD
jgi:hypothetical protein